MRALLDTREFAAALDSVWWIPEKASPWKTLAVRPHHVAVSAAAGAASVTTMDDEFGARCRLENLDRLAHAGAGPAAVHVEMRDLRDFASALRKWPQVLLRTLAVGETVCATVTGPILLLEWGPAGRRGCARFTIDPPPDRKGWPEPDGEAEFRLPADCLATALAQFPFAARLGSRVEPLVLHFAGRRIQLLGAVRHHACAAQLRGSGPAEGWYMLPARGLIRTLRAAPAREGELEGRRCGGGLLLRLGPAELWVKRQGEPPEWAVAAADHANRDRGGSVAVPAGELERHASNIRDFGYREFRMRADARGKLTLRAVGRLSDTSAVKSYLARIWRFASSGEPPPDRVPVRPLLSAMRMLGAETVALGAAEGWDGVVVESPGRPGVVHLIRYARPRRRRRAGY